MRKLRLLLAVAFATTAFSACSGSMLAPDDPPPPPPDCEIDPVTMECTKPTSGS